MDNYNGEKFLDKIYQNLYTSDEVMHTYKKGDKRYESIRRYLERLDRILKRSNKISNKRLIENFCYENFVIKKDDLKKVLNKRNRFYDDIYLNQIIDNQKKSLSNWIDYLSDPSANYPLWAKYWVFQGMLKMGVYDEGLETYQKRTNETEVPFVDANPEIIAKAIEIIEKVVNKSEDVDDDELKHIMNSGSFQKIYSLLEKRCKSDFIKHSGTDGVWIKYNQGVYEDAIKLCDSLQGKNTHWCTAGIGTANAQLSCGDFYVYYTKDKDGKYTIPRIAIRMEGSDYIGEIRGVEEAQNMEEEMIPILEKKLSEMTFVSSEDIKKAKETIEGLKELTAIYKKSINNDELTKNEVEKLYSKGYGFGWSNDPRVSKIKKRRDVVKDFDLVSPEYKISIIFDGNMPEKSIYDKELLLSIVEKYGHYLNLASDELRNDKEVVMTAVKNCYYALKYASDELKNDKEVVFEAAMNNRKALEYASEELRNDKNFMYYFIEQNPSNLYYALDNVKDDKYIVLNAVKKSGNVLEYVSDRLKDDKEVVMAALSKNKHSLIYASKRIKDDKEVALFVLNRNGEPDTAYRIISDRLKNDRDIVMKYVNVSRNALSYIPEKYRDDKEIVLDSININPYLINLVSDRLKNDSDIKMIVEKEFKTEEKNSIL